MFFRKSNSLKKLAKEDFIKIRMKKQKKGEWKNYCMARNISLSSFILNSVEGRLMDNERLEILKFIEKQDNLFVKIENNINQVARIVNGQKHINDLELKRFSDQLLEVVKLKEKQNAVFEKIYSMLAK